MAKNTVTLQRIVGPFILCFWACASFKPIIFLLPGTGYVILLVLFLEVFGLLHKVWKMNEKKKSAS